MKQINDPVFRDLVYDESNKAWTKKINLGIWFGDDYLLDLVVKCGKEEEIVDFQREAFLSYLADLQNIKREFRETLLSYFKNHYEMFNRSWALPEKLKIDVVDSKATLGFFNPKQLFLDRKGNYGWLSNFISEQYLITVVLSDGKPRIFKGWDYLKTNPTDDAIFSKLTFDKEGYMTLPVTIPFCGNGVGDIMFQCAENEEINEAQRNAYQRYRENINEYVQNVPQVLLTYHKENYENSRWYSSEDNLMPDKVNETSLCNALVIKALYFDREGNFGWLAEITGKEHAVSIILSEDTIKVQNGWVLNSKRHGHIIDEVFGVLFLDHNKWVKYEQSDIDGCNSWYEIKVEPHHKDGITPQQRQNYLDYKKNEAKYRDMIPDLLLDYYQSDYEVIEEMRECKRELEGDEEDDEDPTYYDLDHITKERVMDLIYFRYMIYKEDGKRYGWVVDTDWNTSYTDIATGLSFMFSEEGIDMASDEDLWAF
ncbi:MAG: hypothetical protein MJZ00_04565 [Paludibacteraceae bacterium]|nr:hypothetical protein [Paludibacteraceae bacterium]